MKIVREKKLNKDYGIQLIDTEENGYAGLARYDVVLVKYDRKIYDMSKGCYGEKSGDYHFNKTVELFRRIIMLDECRNMAYNNMAAYDGKEEYDDQFQFEKERAKMIERWMLEISNYYGKDSNRGTAIRTEFDIDEVYGEEDE